MYRATIAEDFHRPACMIAATSNPAATRSCAIPTRHEWPETSAGSIPRRLSAGAARRASFLKTSHTFASCSFAPTFPVTWTDRKSGRTFSYRFDDVMEVAGGPARSPYDPQFNPKSVTRIEAVGDDIRKTLDRLDATNTRFVR